VWTVRPHSGSGRHDAWHIVVEALEQVQVLRDPTGRRLCMDLLTEYLGFPLQIMEFPSTRQYLFGFMLACRQHPDALEMLLRVLDQLEPGSRAVERVRQLVEDIQAMELVPDDDRKQLVELVSRAGFPRVAELSRAAAGPAAAEFPLDDQEPEEALGYLENLNARPDGVPPLLVFVEYLAHQVGGHLGDQLREWSENQARKMGVDDRISVLRAEAVDPAIVEEARSTIAHLVIRIERDSLDRGQYLMAHWRQADRSGWHPRRGHSLTGVLPEIERAVAELVEEAEATWARNAVGVHVEFLLPLELLNLPVDQWLVDTDSAIPRPLGLLYQVTLRSLERARTRKWHREWRRRWALLRDDVERAISWWCPANNTSHLRTLDATLASRQEIISLVLRSAPSATRTADASEMLVGLRNGIPVMIWQREGSVRAFENTVRPLISGIGGLPERTRLLRGQAYQSPKPPGHVGSRVTLVWDDPDRLVEPVDLPAAPSVEEVASP
jgi:vWA-MoxR associated protein C-terminal domain/vWA-MoxR associated protein middle region 0/Effector-associated domain 2